MRTVLIVGLTLLVTACGRATPEAAARSFCRELSGGHWEKALRAVGAEQQVKDRLRDGDPDQRQMIEAALSSSRCEVTRMTDDTTASITFDSVDTSRIVRGLIGQSFLALLGGAAPDANQVAGQIRSADAPRQTLVRMVTLRNTGGQWTASSISLFNLMDGATGGMGF